MQKSAAKFGERFGGNAMPIPSQAPDSGGRCRDLMVATLTHNGAGEGKVQTANSDS